MSDFATAPDPLTDGVLTRRVLAWFIDVLIIGVLVAIAGVLVLVLGLLTFGFGFALMAGVPAIGIVYHIVFVAGARSATPGQSMMDLVVRRDADLGPPTLLQAVLFTLGLWATLSIAFVLVAVALITDRKRALHDMLAGVVVVRNRALTHGLGSPNMGPGTPYR
ncbi:MAG: hypothetical protein NVSMB18_21470 [Acetobacteraceae bacterium]